MATDEKRYTNLDAIRDFAYRYCSDFTQEQIACSATRVWSRQSIETGLLIPTDCEMGNDHGKS